MKMGEKEKYLEDLNISFEKYLKTKSIYSFKQVKGKMNEGENKYKFIFRDYYWWHPKWSVADFEKSLSDDVKLLKSLWSKWRKVHRSYEDIVLSNELYALHYQVSLNLTEKCEHKFKNGKYYLVKSKNRVYLHFAELFIESEKKIASSKPEPTVKSKPKKFDDIREYAKQLKREIRPKKRFDVRLLEV